MDEGDPSPEASAEAAGVIRAIDTTSVHQICSGQVILTLATAVKELVENSLDASATNVEVRLKEHGSEGFEVIDNGSGVEEKNFEALTLKHYTSKLTNFSDLVGVETFGFRGEALSSLCALSKLTITTSCTFDGIGTRLEYDHEGKLVSKKPCARQHGTSVFVEQLFVTLPVRHKEFQRNIKKEFAKMVHTLCAYCIANTGVKLTCTNQTGNGKKSTVLSVMGNSAVRDNIADIYGINQLQSLLEIKSTPPEESVLAEYDLQPMTNDRTNFFSISGLISSCEHGRGRSSADRQFYFVNKRPCDPQKMARLVNEVYHMFNRHQYPMVVLDITLSKELVDVNVTPDKRQVFIQHEKLLLATIKTSLMKMFQSLEPICSSVGSTVSFSNGGLGLVKAKPQEPVEERNAARGKLLSASKSKSLPVSSFLSHLKRSFTSAFDKSSQETAGSSDNSAVPAAKQIKIDRVFGKSSESPITSQLTRNSDSGDGKESPAMIASENLELQLDEPSLCDNNSSHLCKRNILTDDHVSCDSHEKCELDHEFTSINSRDNREQLGDLMNSRDQLSLSEKSDSELSDDCWQVKQAVSANSRIDKSKDFVSELQISVDEIETRELVTSSDTDLLVQKHPGDGAKEQIESINEGFVSMKFKTAAAAEVKQHPGSMKKSRKDTTKTLQKKTKVTVTELDAEQSVTKKVVTVNFSMEWLKKTLESRRNDTNSSLASRVRERSFLAQISPSSNEAAENELKKELSKDMFEKMEVIGQFNLGFMVARLNRDLFIIDQHATDEKYNFEQLEKNTVLVGQRLIQPQRLELTAVNESILSENLEIFLKNGFEFTINEAGLSGARILLKSIPTSKNWEFGKDDIEEMIFILSETPGVMCRPSRIRQMLASRACHSSVMIGTALTKPDMKKLIIHMGEIEQPWNCPHGRPTIRHLINLDMVSSRSSSSKLPQDFI